MNKDLSIQTQIDNDGSIHSFFHVTTIIAGATKTNYIGKSLNTAIEIYNDTYIEENKDITI